MEIQSTVVGFIIRILTKPKPKKKGQIDRWLISGLDSLILLKHVCKFHKCLFKVRMINMTNSHDNTRDVLNT